MYVCTKAVLQHENNICKDKNLAISVE